MLNVLSATLLLQGVDDGRCGTLRKNALPNTCLRFLFVANAAAINAASCSLTARKAAAAQISKTAHIIRIKADSGLPWS